MLSASQYEQTTSRDSSFTILKAIAIIFVVVAHSGGPSWLVHAAYIFCVPVFFMSSGFFFKPESLHSPKTFIWRRFRHIYCPFWLWSVAFLLLHNFFYWIGLLSEDYGNPAGGVMHPYSWHDIAQNFWSITFNMSGYDQFIGGAFWFFRTMFLGSIVFYAMFLLLTKFSRWKQPHEVAWAILGLSLALATWQVVGDLRITGIAQGGYRELMAIAFMSMGFLYRHYQSYFRPQWLVGPLGLLVLVLFTWWSPSSMSYKADFVHFVSLPLPAFAAFVALHAFGKWMAQQTNVLTDGLLYIGDRTLYIFAFHLLAFKLVSIVKVLVYGLPWAYVGGHPVVHKYADDDLFFLAYIIVGVGLPLLVLYTWKKLDRNYNLTFYNCVKYSWMGLCIAFSFLRKVTVKSVVAIWKSVTGFFKDICEFVKASNPKDE